MKKKFFSLLEILTVIVIIGTLISFIAPATLQYLHKVRSKECQLMVHRINFAIKSYINDCNAYFLQEPYTIFELNPSLGVSGTFQTRITEDFILNPYDTLNFDKTNFLKKK